MVVVLHVWCFFLRLEDHSVVVIMTAMLSPTIIDNSSSYMSSTIDTDGNESVGFHYHLLEWNRTFCEHQK
jgi:hypothetical protein